MTTLIHKKNNVATYHKEIKRRDLTEMSFIEQKRYKAKVRADDVYRLRHLENRARLSYMRSTLGLSLEDISKQTGLAVSKVEWYLDWALQRTLQTPEEYRLMPKVKTPRIIGVSPLQSRSVPVIAPALVPLAQPNPPSPSNDPEIQRQAFRLRTNMVPIDEIAETLDISPQEASRAIRIHADALNQSEISETEIARRIQVEQIDQILREITPLVLGKNKDGTDRIKGVVLEAIDRYVKLLEAKSKLLGMNAPQKVDMDIRLQKIAETGEFDYETLRSLFEEVVQEYPSLTAGS